MGHRANFVLIRNGQATAYYDQWAALGSTYLFAAGPEQATAAAEEMESTRELLDWAFAEAGYLLDFDEMQALVFGYPEGEEFEDEEFEVDDEGEEGAEDDEVGESDATDLESSVDLDSALRRSPLAFLEFIAPRWQGWHLHWDDRGVDAFAAHLERRGIGSIATQPASHPADSKTASFRA